jgi:hypothetical protein
LNLVNTIPVDIDLKQNLKVPFQTINQNDSNKLLITINEAGSPADLSNVDKIVLNYRKPNGIVLTYTLQNIDNTAEFTLGKNEMDVPGLVHINLQLINANERATTIQFSFYVTEIINAMFENGEGMPLLQELFAETTKLIEDANEATNLANIAASKNKKTVVYVGDFTGNDNEIKIQAAIDFAHSNNIKTVLLEDVTYIISGMIDVKDDVKLLGGYGTSFTVYGSNYNVLNINKNASAENITVRIDDSNFIGNVIYLEGSNKYYNSWNRLAMRDITIVDWNDFRKCKGIKLFADNDGDEISFLEFDSIKLVNLDVGIDIEVLDPGAGGTAYVNANMFNNVTIEGCNEMINIESGITVPNEFSGNLFTNLQIQPSYATQKLITVNGGYNRFSGMIWDLHLIPHSNDVIFLTSNSEHTTFDIQNMPVGRTSDLGSANNLGRRVVLESRTSDPINTVIGQMWFRSDL